MRTGSILVCTLGLALASCTPQEANDTADPCVHDPPLDHDNFGDPFLEQFCNGCHSQLVPPDHRNGAPEGVDFDEYALVMQWAVRIEARTVLFDDPANAMPPGGGPTDDERGKLHEWLQCAVMPDFERWNAQGGEQ